MDGGKGKRRQNSLDDILGDLLSEDTQTKPAPSSNSSKGKKGLKDDDFYSNLAEVAGGDPESDISEADVDQVAKSIADLDDMDADLFGGPSKRNSVKSRGGKPTTPRRSSNTPRSRNGTPRSGKQGSPRRAPGSPTRGEGSPRGSIKRPPPKPSSPSPPSSDYKPGTAPGKMTDLGRESENLKPGQSFKTDSERPQTVPRAKPKIDYGEFNEDDPLAGLLSDEEDSIMETKKKTSFKKTLNKRSSSDDIFSSSEPKIDSPALTETKVPEEKSPSLYERPPTRSGAGTVTPEAKSEDAISKPVPKNREERLFSDDDSMLDGLGIDEKPKTPAKEAVKDEDASRPARSALDSLLGKDSVNKHLQKAERKEFILDTKKFSQRDEDSDEDLVFGEYKPSSVGGSSRPTSRRSVRFQDDDIFGTDDKPPSRGRPDSAKSSKAEDDMDWLELASGNRVSIDVKNTAKPFERKDTKSISKSGSFDWLGLKDSSNEDKEVNQSETKTEKKTLSRHEDNDDWLSKLKTMNHGEDEVDAPSVKEKTTPVVKDEPKVNVASSQYKDDYLGLGKEIDFDDILTEWSSPFNFHWTNSPCINSTTPFDIQLSQTSDMASEIAFSSKIYSAGSGTVAFEGCKIYQTSSLQQPDISLTQQYLMNNALKPDESFLNKLQQQTEKSTNLLKTLVRDIRFLSMKPKLNQDTTVETKLKDWTPEMKGEMASSENQNGCQVVIQKESADVRTRVCKMLTKAGIDVSTIDDQHLQDFVDHLQNEMGGKNASDVFGSDVNHYQFLETSEMPRNEDEMTKIRKYLDEGCGDSIVISHQIHRQSMNVPESRLSPIMLELVPPTTKHTSDMSSIYKAVLDNPKTWLSL